MFEVEIYDKEKKQLRETGKLISNSMMNGEELKKVSIHEHSKFHVTDGGIYTTYPENGYIRLAFSVLSDQFPQSLLSFMNQNQDMGKSICVFDLVGRTKTVRKHSQLLEEAGLIPYARYSRYVLKNRKTPKGMYQSLCLDSAISFGLACEEDCKEIARIFQSNFDHFTSHVPFSADSVMKHIRDHEICVARYGGEIAAAFCYEILDEQHVHLNVVASADQFESLGLAVILYEYVLDLFTDGTTFYCWIEENNRPSLEMHQALGFEKDEKMCFHIFVYDICQ